MSMIPVIVIWLLVLVALLFFEVLIGVYVYRDATRRGMNALLWTLVAVFAPSLIGFIIYLIVRNNYSDLKCPQCDTTVTEQFVICPKCGVKLKPFCPNCSAPVEPDWKMCPKCASHLPEQYDGIVQPHYVKDKTLWKILVVVIVIPILLISLLIGGMLFTYTFSSGGGSFILTTDVNTLCSAQETDDVKEWLESCDDNGTAYAMQYATTTPEGDKQYFYLLCVSGAAEGPYVGAGTSYGGLFSDVFKVEFEKGESDKNTVYCIESWADKSQRLEVYLDNQKINCEITEVDFNPVKNLIVDEENDWGFNAENP